MITPPFDFFNFAIFNPFFGPVNDPGKIELFRNLLCNNLHDVINLLYLEAVTNNLNNFIDVFDQIV